MKKNGPDDWGMTAISKKEEALGPSDTGCGGLFWAVMGVPRAVLGYLRLAWALWLGLHWALLELSWGSVGASLPQ